ncbi:MAG: bifunctional adenosylcobinamide kinase/adenosylcobinamide-phosphate guanylyltransferase [Defluviitaleaceae bacterium]|nr:bifunctional adenosylcobinamide kinase/adenosylcobinamide-phosphate guanylyltransferase [Defluviitaleaceae bacterium]
MKVFISGGVKNGKSFYAQRIAKRQQTDSNTPLYYIATMDSTDREDDERIIRHRNEREGWGFTTIEQPRNIENILEKCDYDGSFLLDSLTALLANEMFTPSGDVNPDAHKQIAEGLIEVISKVNRIVIVSDYIYSDAILYDPLTEQYRRILAALDSMVAQSCDIVLEAVYSQMIIHKGKDVADFALS